MECKHSTALFSLGSLLSDPEDIRIRLQGAIGLVGENLLGKGLAQLYTFLVEGVDVPAEALEHDLVLVVGEKGAEGLRRQLVADDDGRR